MTRDYSMEVTLACLMYFTRIKWRNEHAFRLHKKKAEIFVKGAGLIQIL